jgi:hypothetical protein
MLLCREEVVEHFLRVSQEKPVVWEWTLVVRLYVGVVREVAFAVMNPN